ncbi:hypothetical protein P7C70_g610, partial [Phenoliferia sp. Uapishka_3]
MLAPRASTAISLLQVPNRFAFCTSSTDTLYCSLTLSPVPHQAPPTYPNPTNNPNNLITMASTTSTSTVGSIVNTVSDAANYVSETVQETISGASKEGNKEVAKGNTGASLTDRASAGFSAVGDSSSLQASSNLGLTDSSSPPEIDESSHAAKGSAYKESAKN